MKNISIIICSVFALFVLSLLTPLNSVYAQNACDSKTCQTVCTTTWSYDCTGTNPYTGACTAHQWTPHYNNCVCQYTSSSGTCTCCITINGSTGCYFTCPGSGGGSTPGPGGGVPSPTSPPPTPALPATLQAVAVQVTPVDTSCTAVHNAYLAGSGVSGTTFGFTVNPPAPQTQSGATVVSFSNVTPGAYTLTATPPAANWVVTAPCYYVNGTLIGSGYTAVANGGATVKWEVGYTKGTAWVQTRGGDAYASGTMRSYIPTVSPRVFNDVGSGGYPGVVIYGTSFDFDSDPYSTGGTLVSSKNWLVNATRPTVNYYDLFYHRFGAPTATDNASFGNLAAVTKPASKATPYYITGDMTTSGNWTVGSSENIVFLVDGNLTIGGNINITPNSTGFVSFIVNGNITVDPAVGTTAASTAPVVEGIYIASNALASGIFSTGVSTAIGTARFVGKGMFIADNFLLQRDLDGYGGNTATSAELFTYNPQLLLTMPEAMKELPITWSEVAP